MKKMIIMDMQINQSSNRAVVARIHNSWFSEKSLDILYIVFIGALLVAGWGKIDIDLASTVSLSIGGSTRALFYIVFVLYLIIRMIRRDLRKVCFIRDPLTIFGLCCITSTWLSSPDDFYTFSSTFLPAILAYFVIRYLLQNMSKASVERYLKSIIFFALLVLLRAFADAKGNYFINPTIMSTTSEHHTIVAMITLSVFPLCVGFLSIEKKKKLPYIFALFVMLMGMILCNSRIGWFTFFVLVLYLILLMKSSNVRYTLLAFIVVGFVSFLFLFPHLHKRFLSLFNLIEDRDFQLRMQVWSYTLAIIREHFIIGIGFSVDQFKSVGALYIKDFAFHHPHNFILAVLVYTGIIGFSVFLWIMVKIVRDLVILTRVLDNAMKIYIQALKVSFLGFFLMNMVDNVFTSPRASLLFFVLMACLFFMRESYDNSKYDYI